MCIVSFCLFEVRAYDENGFRLKSFPLYMYVFRKVISVSQISAVVEFYGRMMVICYWYKRVYFIVQIYATHPGPLCLRSIEKRHH